MNSTLIIQNKELIKVESLQQITVSDGRNKYYEEDEVVKGLHVIGISQDEYDDMIVRIPLNNLEALHLTKNRLHRLSIKSDNLIFLNLSDSERLESVNLITPKLKKLILNQTRVRNLDVINPMESMEYLELGNCSFKECPNLDYPNLRLIDLRGAGFETLSLPILAKLESLILEDATFSKIKVQSNGKGKGRFSALESLRLKNLNLIDLDFLKYMNELKWLDVSGNNLSDPKQLNGLKPFLKRKDHFLNIYDNPIGSRILEENSSDNHVQYMIDTFKDIKGEVLEQKPLPLKVFLLGNHGSGKSSFANHFFGDPPNNQESTKILQVRKYENPTLENSTTHILYDFGGQDIYHNIYRLFLSDRSLYLIFWRIETDERKYDEEVNYGLDQEISYTHYYDHIFWLEQKKYLEKLDAVSISLLDMNPAHNSMKNLLTIKEYNENENVSGPPVICVNVYTSNPIKNHLLLIQNRFITASQKDSEQVQTIDQRVFTSSIETDFANAYKLDESLSTSYPTTSKQGTRVIKASQNLIKELVLDYGKDVVEYVNKILFKKIGELGKDKLIVSKSKINEETNFDDTDLEEELLRLHQSGYILYYPDWNGEYIFHEPQKVALELINYLHNNPKFTNGLLPNIKNKQSYLDSNSTEGVLLDLLEYFKIILYDKKYERYIIPGYLRLPNKDSAEYQLSKFGSFEDTFTLFFDRFMPLGLMNRLMVLFGNKPSLKQFWKNELIFTENEANSKIWIKADYVKLTLDVRISNASMNSGSTDTLKKYLFLSIISAYWNIEHLEYIDFNANYRSYLSNTDEENTKKEYTDINSKILLNNSWLSMIDKGFIDANKYFYDNPDNYYIFGVPEDLHLSIDGIDFIHWKNLCPKGETKNKVASVPKVIPISYQRVKDEIKQKTNSGQLSTYLFNPFILQKIMEPLKVFISYSKRDSLYKNNLIAHLRVQEKMKKIRIWHDKEIESGEDWNQSIQNQLLNSDIIILLISHHFFDSSYIWEKELEPALERAAREECHVLPVLIHDCDWASQGFEGFDHKLDTEDIDKKSADYDVSKFNKISYRQFLPFFSYENEDGFETNNKLRAASKWPKGYEPMFEVAKAIKAIVNAKKNKINSN